MEMQFGMHFRDLVKINLGQPGKNCIKKKGLVGENMGEVHCAHVLETAETWTSLVIFKDQYSHLVYPHESTL